MERIREGATLTLEEIAQECRKIMKRKRIKQSEIAEALKVSKPSVNHALNARPGGKKLAPRILALLTGREVEEVPATWRLGAKVGKPFTWQE